MTDTELRWLEEYAENIAFIRDASRGLFVHLIHRSPLTGDVIHVMGRGLCEVVQAAKRAYETGEAANGD